MKIAGVETLTLSRAHEPERQWFTAHYRSVKADCAIVAIDTDEGLRGIGEACAYSGLPEIKEVVAWLRPELIGRNVDDWMIIPHPNGRSMAYDSAVAGIDSALWDLRGQQASEHVCKLLVPQPLDRVRLYASSGVRLDWRDQPESLIEEVFGHLADGYTGCKVRIGTEWAWDGITTDHYMGLMRDLAAAVDGRMELMVDGNQRLTVDQALTIGRERGRLGFIWFEEPIPQTDIDGYVTLSKTLDIPISGGESSSPCWSSSNPTSNDTRIASCSPTLAVAASPRGYVSPRRLHATASTAAHTVGTTPDGHGQRPPHRCAAQSSRA